MSVVTDVRSGAHDDLLNDLLRAVQDRRKALAADVAAALRPGDKVRFSAVIKPKYLVGLEATVVRINRESVVVNCPADPAYGRFSGSKQVRCPNALIEGA